jgi:hypothetical protein
MGLSALYQAYKAYGFSRRTKIVYVKKGAFDGQTLFPQGGNRDLIFVQRRTGVIWVRRRL